MSLKTWIYSNAFVAAVLASGIAPHLDAGILDIVSEALTKKVVTTPPAVRVLLAHDIPGTIIEVKGKYKIHDPHTNSLLGKGIYGKRRFIQPLVDGIRWGEEFPGVHQLVITPDDIMTTIIVDGIEYQGQVYVYDVGGSISVVNQIDVEDYLNTILPQRYTQPFLDEVLAAVVIAERTNIYTKMQNSKTHFWDLDAKKEGYNGYALGCRSKPIEMSIYKTQYIAMQPTGAAESNTKCLLVDWYPSAGEKGYQDVTYSKVNANDADRLAKRGKNAAEILKEAFPSSSLQLSYRSAK